MLMEGETLYFSCIPIFVQEDLYVVTDGKKLVILSANCTQVSWVRDMEFGSEEDDIWTPD